jgi:hypothetical protein
MGFEILILAYRTFQRHKSVYFWSIIVTTSGIHIYTTAVILTYFGISHSRELTLALLNIGWICMISGFSMVLWSRLHLIISNKRFLTATLCIIFFNGIATHSITISLIVSLVFNEHRADVGHDLNIAGAAVFTAQEALLTFLYIFKTIRFLKSGYSIHVRRMIGMLLLVQILVICLDALGMSLAFTNRVVLAAICEPFFYCVRLKLEIAVLNELQDLVKRGRLPGLSLDINQPAPSVSSQNPASSSDKRALLTTYNHKPLAPPDVEITSPCSPQALSSNNGANEVGIQELTTGIQNTDDIFPVAQGGQRVSTKICGHMKYDGDDLEARYLGRWSGDGIV